MEREVPYPENYSAALAPDAPIPRSLIEEAERADIRAAGHRAFSAVEDLFGMLDEDLSEFTADERAVLALAADLEAMVARTRALLRLPAPRAA